MSIQTGSVRCSSLAALPESIGQLQALTELYLVGCSSLADESRERWNFFEKRNMRIFNDRALRFPITTHVFKATVLFGSMKASNGMTNADPSAASGSVPCSSPVLGAFSDCIQASSTAVSRTWLPSPIWRLIADYSGVSYKAAFEKWVTEIELKIKEDLGLSDVLGLVELE